MFIHFPGGQRSVLMIRMSDPPRTWCARGIRPGGPGRPRFDLRERVSPELVGRSCEPRGLADSPGPGSAGLRARVPHAPPADLRFLFGLRACPLPGCALATGSWAPKSILPCDLLGCDAGGDPRSRGRVRDVASTSGLTRAHLQLFGSACTARVPHGVSRTDGGRPSSGTSCRTPRPGARGSGAGRNRRRAVEKRGRYASLPARRCGRATAHHPDQISGRASRGG